MSKSKDPQVYHHDSDNQPDHSKHDSEVISDKKVNAYWQANIRLLLTLLVVWFAVSFGAGILFADWLNQFVVAGFPLGFWFAQQGSIYVFVVLIFIYTRQMRVIESRFGVDDDEQEGDAP